MENKPIILIADDSQDDILFVVRALRKFGLGESVRTVNDGEEAIAYLKGTPPFQDRQCCPLPHLLLLDLKMPKVDGFEVLEWIQTQAELSQLPVVVFSSSSLESDMTKAKALGACDYKTKPNDSEELATVLRELTMRWLRPGACLATSV